jgi:hypothetical protein
MAEINEIQEVKVKIKRLLVILVLPFLLGACQVVDSLTPVETAAAPGTVLFADDFANNNAHWGIADTAKGAVALLYQGMDIQVKQANAMMWTVTQKKYADTQVDVDAVLLNGSQDDAFGTICRFQDNDHFYGFLVTHDGYYGIFKMQDGKLVLANAESNLQYSDVIRQGGVVNHIQATCQGNVLKLNVNGQLLAMIEDDSYASGKVGLMAAAYASPNVELFFDHFLVTQP